MEEAKATQNGNPSLNCTSIFPSINHCHCSMQSLASSQIHCGGAGVLLRLHTSAMADVEYLQGTFGPLSV